MNGWSRSALVVVIAFDHLVEKLQSDSSQVTTAPHVDVHNTLPSHDGCGCQALECLRVFGLKLLTMPDARFARIRTDPRFKKLKKQQKKLIVDARFKPLLKDDDEKKDKKKSKCA